MGEPLIVNKGELAKFFSVSIPTIDAWIDGGMPVHKEGSNGVAWEFDTASVKAWRDDKARRDADTERQRQARLDERQREFFGDEQMAPAGFSASDIREKAEAELKVIQLNKTKGLLIERDDVQRDYAAVFGVIRQDLMSFASSLARQASLSPDQQKIAERMARETLVRMNGQIKDPELRPAPEDMGDVS